MNSYYFFSGGEDVICSSVGLRFALASVQGYVGLQLFRIDVWCTTVPGLMVPHVC